MRSTACPSSPVMRPGLITDWPSPRWLWHPLARFAATASVGLAERTCVGICSLKVQDFSFADIDRFSTSSLVHTHDDRVTNVQNAFGMMIPYRCAMPLMIIFSVVMAWRISVQMALIFLGMVPVLAIILAAIIAHRLPDFPPYLQKYDASNNSVQENVAANRVVKSFNHRGTRDLKFRSASADVRKDFTNAEKLIALNPAPSCSSSLYVVAVDAWVLRSLSTRGQPG